MNIKASRLSKILIADDHILVAGALASALELRGEFQTDLSYDLNSTLQKLDVDDTYNVILLDVNMPGMNGLFGVQRVVEKAFNSFVVLFSSSVDERFLDHAIRLGARGLIPKSLPLRSLQSILKLVESGEVFVPALLPTDTQNFITQSDLNDVERNMMKLVSAGMTNRQISYQLDMSEAKIKMLMMRVCTKLGARNRAHAAMLATKLGILDL
ncbi:MAG: response regulator transcription factor [Loktanella sp.]|nr:response regulator transcription factor [Loktanella sp.]